MTETDEQRQNRMLDELKGKNVAHYSVMLNSYISSRIEINKAIFAFASAGFGLLLTIISKHNVDAVHLKIALAGAITTFGLAAISTLIVYSKHSKSIETALRADGEKRADFELKTWMYVNYFLFSAGIILTLIFAIACIYPIDTA